MIENLFGGGGGGGTVDTITAGTGISVNSTDPANPIITNTSLNTDEVAKISSNDTTAGYLNGKLVAGSGITLTENNNGGNETLTVAAAVTSVNGSTGAVTVAAGDTTYTVTTADVENTSTRTRYIAFTVPANTWADGERIELFFVRQMLQNSGSTYTWQDWLGGTGITETTQGFQNVSSVGLSVQTVHNFEFYRLGNTVVYSRVFASAGNATPLYYTGLNVTNSYTNFFVEDTSLDFTQNITIYLEGKWSGASPSAYQRILWAKAFKTAAGQQ